jgi:hypothetical protein
LRSVAPRIKLALQTQRGSSHQAALSAKVPKDAEADRGRTAERRIGVGT